MPRITDLAQDSDVESSDRLAGTDGTGGSTKSFTLESILSAFIATGDWNSLPTTEPTDTGRVWNDEGTLKVS